MIIGGDIAYDNSFAYCYYSWDNFYAMVEKLGHQNEAGGRLVPLILSIGNH